MGGYAAYVWPAYAISGLAIGGLIFAVWRRGRDLRRRLAEAAKDAGSAADGGAAGGLAGGMDADGA